MMDTPIGNELKRISPLMFNTTQKPPVAKILTLARILSLLVDESVLINFLYNTY